MAINFPYGFTVTSTEPIDTRQLMTPAQMKAAGVRMPDYYITICSEGADAGKLFIYNKNNESDETYGRFKRLAHSDLAGLPVVPTMLSQLEADAEHNTVSTAQIAAWNAKLSQEDVAQVALTGSYNDLIDTPIIPTQLSQLTDDATHRLVTDAEKATWNAGTPNIIEVVKVDGTPLPVENKAVNVDLSGKVDKVAGKQLSAEDYTTAEKTKLSTVAEGAQVNVIESVKVNGTALPVDNKAVNVAVPTKVSDLTNDTGFITANVDNLTNYYTKTVIDEKLSGSMQYKTASAKADGTPNVAVPEEKTIYLVPSKSAKSKNAKDEYLWVDNEWELIGSTTMKLAITQSADGITINEDALQDATSSQDGLMTKEAFSKLSGIEAGAQANVNADWNAVSGDAQILNKPTIPASLSDLADDATHRVVTDAQIASWDAHIQNVQSDWGEIDSSAESYIRNKPVIPSALSDLADDATHRLVTDEQIAAWSDHEENVQSDWGEMDSSADSYIRNKPVIPSQLSDLGDDATHRLVTDTEKSAWNSYEANVLETVKVDGTTLVAVDKAVDIPLTETVREMLEEYDPKTMSISPWDAETGYLADSVVIYESKLYISTYGTLEGEKNIGHIPSETGSAYWSEVIGTSSSEGSTTTTITAVTYQFGNDVDVEYSIPHKFQSYDFIYSIRTNDNLRRYIQADVYANSANSAVVKLSDPPGTNGMVINLLKCITSSSSNASSAKSEVISEPAASWSVSNTSRMPVFVQTFRSTDGKNIYGDILQEDETEFDPVTVDFGEPVDGYIVYAPSIGLYTFENETSVEIDTGAMGYFAVQVVSETDGEGVINPDVYESNGVITINFGTGVTKSGYVTVVKPAKVVYMDNMSTWTYTHNLNRYVGVQAYIPSNGLASAATMEFYNDSTSTCRIVWDAPMSGYMIIV